MANRVRPVPKLWDKLDDCTVCGWTYPIREMRMQKGGLVCTTCYDREDKHTKVKRGGKRL